MTPRETDALIARWCLIAGLALVALAIAVRL